MKYQHFSKVSNVFGVDDDDESDDHSEEAIDQKPDTY